MAINKLLLKTPVMLACIDQVNKLQSILFLDIWMSQMLGSLGEIVSGEIVSSIPLKLTSFGCFDNWLNILLLSPVSPLDFIFIIDYLIQNCSLSNNSHKQWGSWYRIFGFKANTTHNCVNVSCKCVPLGPSLLRGQSKNLWSLIQPTLLE